MGTKQHLNGRSRILLIDAMPLRRACIANLLRGCGRAFDITTLSDIADSGHAMNGASDAYALVLLNVGNGTAREPVTERAVAHVHTAHPEAHLAILSDRDDPRDVVAAFRCGARGFLPTSLEPEVAIGALKLMLAGGEFYPPTALAGQEEGAMRAAAPVETERQNSALPLLTPRQNEVLGLLRQGQSNKHIARELDMRESTVKVHVRQIMRKLGVTNRTQAALMAARPAPEPRHPPAADGIRPREVAREARLALV